MNQNKDGKPMQLVFLDAIFALIDKSHLSGLTYLEVVGALETAKLAIFQEIKPGEETDAV
jgi:hypothetical protein